MIEEWGIDVAGDFEALVDAGDLRQGAGCDRGVKRRRSPAISATTRSSRCVASSAAARCSRPLTGGWSKGKRARYAYYNCPVAGGINVRRQQLEARFVAAPGPTAASAGGAAATLRRRARSLERGAEGRRRAAHGRSSSGSRRYASARSGSSSAYLYEGAIDKETYQHHLGARRGGADARRDRPLRRRDRRVRHRGHPRLRRTPGDQRRAACGSRRRSISGSGCRSCSSRKVSAYDGKEFRTPLTCPFFSNFEGTSGQTRVKWWSRRDSNPRPPRCERGALPAELLPHRGVTRRRAPPGGSAIVDAPYRPGNQGGSGDGSR